MKNQVIYKKLHKTWSNGYANHIKEFENTFPELKKLNSEDLCKRFRSLNLEFYTEKQIIVKWHIRITLPFALIVILLMILSLPLVFLITGKWNYGEPGGFIYNWFKSLKLL